MRSGFGFLELYPEGDHGVVLFPRRHILGGLHVAIRLGVGVSGALDKDVVTRVLVGLDELGSLRIGTGDNDSLRAEDVALEASSHQAVDVLAG